MYAEVLGGFGLLAFLLIFIAELSNKKLLGIVAGAIFLLTSIWLVTDDRIQLQTGEIAILTQTNALNNTLNTTLVGYSSLNASNNLTAYNESLNGLFGGATTTSYTRNVTAIRTNITTSLFRLPSVLGYIFAAIGFYLIIAYSLDIVIALGSK